MPKKLTPKTFNAFLGAEIKSRLDKKGLGHEDLLTLFDWSLTTVGRKMRGVSPLTVQELLGIAAFLNVPAASILDTALADFGGIDRLLSEGKGSTGGVVTKVDFEGRKASGELDAAANEIDPESLHDE